jgi:hypothetical protein
MSTFRRQVAAERAGGNPFGRSRIDFGVWSHHRWKEEFGIDGVYYDTCHFFPNYNTVSGTAYRLPDGRIQPGWTVFGQREYFKRSAIMFGDPGQTNWTWGNIFCGAQISGWQYAVTDGEGSRAPGTDYFDDSFVTLRVMANPEKWGKIRMWGMGTVAESAWEKQPLAAARLKRHFYAEILQFGARKSWGGRQPKALLDFPVPFRNLADSVPPGGDDVIFHPFWETAHFASTGDNRDEPLLGIYEKPNGAMLLIVSNLTDRTLKDLEISCDLEPLNLAESSDIVVTDAEEPYLPPGGEFVIEPISKWPNEKYYRWLYYGGFALLKVRGKEVEPPDIHSDGGGEQLAALWADGPADLDAEGLTENFEGGQDNERGVSGVIENGRLHVQFTVGPHDFRLIHVTAGQ